ncbi:MAG TPA: SPOR domain-containing protein, partial [Phenylobacterium sp.]|nr:SPOR domain-containing protein [Phenylobacterium sp.]
PVYLLSLFENPVVLVVAIVLIYRSGAQESGEAPPVVGAPVGEMKGQPAADAQPVDPATGLQIYQSELGEPAPAQPNFVPPPEEPQVRPAPEMRPTTPVESRPAPPAAATAPAPAAPAPEPKAAAPAPKPAPAPT